MTRMPPLVPFASRSVISPAVACDLLSIRKTKLYELLGAGVLVSVKRGSRRYIFTQSIHAMVDAWRAENGGGEYESHY